MADGLSQGDLVALFPSGLSGNGFAPAKPSSNDREGRGASAPAGLNFDVPALTARLRLKAEAARWAAERQRLIANRAAFRQEIAPQDQDLLTRAKATDTYLWMLDPHGPRPADIDAFDLIVPCYETLAEAVALAERVLPHEAAQADEIETSLALLAEAQSALRSVVSQCGGQTDSDQELVYRALKEITVERRIYLETGMRISSPVKPSGWAAIAGRIQTLGQSFKERERAGRKIGKLLKNLRYKVSELSKVDNPKPDDWAGLIRVVDELISADFPPSRTELRDALLPVADRLPSPVEGSKGFGLVLREIERFRSRPVSPPEEATSESPTEDVRRVAELLRGRTLVMIGGDERAEAVRAIEQAFGLKGVVWVATLEHESYRNFEPSIAGRDVAAVVLLIRWASHSFGEVKPVCERYGKPLVRLPGGYNPNQIAAAILSQASDRLGGQSGAI